MKIKRVNREYAIGLAVKNLTAFDGIDSVSAPVLAAASATAQAWVAIAALLEPGQVVVVGDGPTRIEMAA